MKYDTLNLKELGEHFVQLEEIITCLECLESGAPDVIATDSSTIKDLGLTKDEISTMELKLKVSISEDSRIMDIAKAMKAQT